MSTEPTIQCQYFAWRLYIRKNIYYADGRSKLRNLGRHSLGTRDYDEAVRNLARLDVVKAVEAGLANRSMLENSGSNGPSLDSGRRRYEQFLGRPAVAGGPSESTRNRYRPIFNKFLNYATKRKIARWSEVNDKVVQDYLAEREAEGAATRTLYMEGTLVKQVVGYLVDEGELPSQSRLKFKMSKPRGSTTYCWTPDQVEAMRTHCAANPRLTWLGDIITALARTGVRIGELLNLRWGDIRLSAKEGVLHIVNEIDAASPDQNTRRTKGRRSRSLPIHPDLLVILQRLGKATGGYVFGGPRGGHLKPDDVRQALIKRVLVPLKERFPTAPGERGFGGGRLHSFRHFFVSQAANSGTPMKVVQDWLGHRDSEMVGHYFHLREDQSQRFIRGVKFTTEDSEDSVVPGDSVA